MNSDDKMVSFFSFLAGFFLLRRSSTCGELSYLMNDFTNRFNIYIDDDNHHRSSYLRRKDNGISE